MKRVIAVLIIVGLAIVAFLEEFGGVKVPWLKDVISFIAVVVLFAWFDKLIYDLGAWAREITQLLTDIRDRLREIADRDE